MKTPGMPPIPRVTVQIDVVDGPEEMIPRAQAVVADALRRASFRAAEMVRTAWVATAKGLGLVSNGDYIDGIATDGRIEVTGPMMDPNADFYETMITVTNTAQHASIVEDGHGAYSLPQAIRWGATPKVKYTRKGTPYLTIPFRHRAYQTPSQQTASGMTSASKRSMMPAGVYAKAKSLARSMPLNAGPQYDARGRYRAADRYTWGGRLRAADAQGKGGQRGAREVGVDAKGNTLTNPAWTSSKWQGMVKMGGVGHSAYLTFRIITPNSKGWRIPARAGHHVARQVLQEIENGELGRAIGEVLQQDITAAVESVKESP